MFCCIVYVGSACSGLGHDHGAVLIARLMSQHLSSLYFQREEFVQLMKERFLSGADSQFVDYNAIDM